jgi:hypothetical protein
MPQLPRDPGPNWPNSDSQLALVGLFVTPQTSVRPMHQIHPLIGRLWQFQGGMRWRQKYSYGGYIAKIKQRKKYSYMYTTRHVELHMPRPVHVENSPASLIITNTTTYIVFQVPHDTSTTCAIKPFPVVWTTATRSSPEGVDLMTPFTSKKHSPW